MSPTIHVVRECSDLDRLEGDWDSLATTSSTPMQQFIWARCCALSFKPDLFVVVSSEAGRATAIAPLVLTPGPLRRLELLGMHHLCEATDFLYAAPSALSALSAFLLESGCPICLRRLPAQSAAVAALTAACSKRGIVVRQETSGCPWISLDTGWQHPEQHLNAGRRSDLRRSQRLAAKAGTVRTEVLSPRVDELRPLLEEALRVESASWKGCNGSALISDSVRGRFFRAYAEAAAAQGILRLCFLRIGGYAAAMQLAVEWDQRFWLLKIGYDERFARCSPGILLMQETIRHAAERGLRSYEFLGEAESWTRLWAQTEHPTITLSVYPARPSSLARFAGDLPRLVFRQVRGFVRKRRLIRKKAP